MGMEIRQQRVDPLRNTDPTKQQLTVGVGGAGAALPVLPRGYLRFTDAGGTVRVIPFYDAQ